MSPAMKIVLLVACVIGLSFLKPVKVKFNEVVNAGTVTGVATCVDLNSNAVISAEATKQGCAKVFQKRLFGPDIITGRASAGANTHEVVFSGTLENTTSDKVITSVDFIYSVFDAEGNETEYLATTPLWIEPRSNSEFSVPLDDYDVDSFTRRKGCDNDGEIHNNCWNWGFYDVQGVSLN